MNFSLLQVDTEYPDGCVDGILIRHCVGTSLEDASDIARNIEKVNSNVIGSPDIAVIDHITHAVCIGEKFYNRERLDLISIEVPA